MIATEVLVRLAAPDPWSFTVLDALSRKFGMREVVDVRRAKSWDLAFDLTSPEAAVAQTRELLRSTALLANPNRDVWAVRCGPVKLPGGFWPEETGDAPAFVVKVTDSEDIIGASTAGIIRTRLGMKTVREMRFSTLWLLSISGATPEARALAERIAVARTWRSGLLANPHFQKARVFGVGEYLAEDGER